MKKIKALFTIVFVIFILSACRQEEEFVPQLSFMVDSITQTIVPNTNYNSTKTYLTILNESRMLHECRVEFNTVFTDGTNHNIMLYFGTINSGITKDSICVTYYGKYIQNVSFIFLEYYK